MSHSAPIRFYAILLIVAYAVWATYFLSVGFYAATLETVDLTTRLDRMIPAVPWMVWIYDLCYFLPIAAILLIRDGHLINRLLIAVFVSTVAASVVYLTVPVAYPVPDFGDSLSARFLEWQFAIDFQPGANKMPSNHVANGFLVWLALRSRGPRTSGILLFLVLLICLSTLLVKKHLVMDVATGTLWAFGAWWVAGRVYAKFADNSLPPDRALLKLLGLGRA